MIDDSFEYSQSPISLPNQFFDEEQDHEQTQQDQTKLSLQFPAFLHSILPSRHVSVSQLNISTPNNDFQHQQSVLDNKQQEEPTVSKKLKVLETNEKEEDDFYDDEENSMRGPIIFEHQVNYHQQISSQILMIECRTLDVDSFSLIFGYLIFKSWPNSG